MSIITRGFGTTAAAGDTIITLPLSIDISTNDYSIDIEVNDIDLSIEVGD